MVPKHRCRAHILSHCPCIFAESTYCSRNCDFNPYCFCATTLASPLSIRREDVFLVRKGTPLAKRNHHKCIQNGTPHLGKKCQVEFLHPELYAHLVIFPATSAEDLKQFHKEWVEPDDLFVTIKDDMFDADDKGQTHVIFQWCSADHVAFPVNLPNLCPSQKMTHAGSACGGKKCMRAKQRATTEKTKPLAELPQQPRLKKQKLKDERPDYFAIPSWPVSALSSGQFPATLVLPLFGGLCEFMPFGAEWVSPCFMHPCIGEQKWDLRLVMTPSVPTALAFPSLLPPMLMSPPPPPPLTPAGVPKREEQRPGKPSAFSPVKSLLRI